MAKAIKTAVKAFVVTFLVVTGVAFIGGVLGISALSGLVALDIAVLTATGSLLNGLFSKGVNAVSENFGTKVATRTATAPRQIIYGKARVGGTITHIETSGTDNYKLSMIVVLAGHEVESLEEVLINDTKLTTTSSGGFQYATNSRFINTDNENNFGSGRLLRYKFKDGSQTTADSTITGATSLGSNDKFIGMAYMLIEMVFDSEAFGGGIPPLAFVIKGKKVYDPRTSTTAWSDNPALCVRDYITDTTYGLKATSDEVLDTTALGGFASAANTCDSAAGAITTATVNGAVSNLSVVQIDASPTNSLIDVGQIVTGTGISGTVRVIYRFGNLVYLNTTVTVADGVTLTFNEELYKANGITNMAADGSGVLEGLLSSCAGKISYINGKFVMFAGASVTPDMTITDDNLLAPISVQTKNSGGETFNTVKAVYVDGNNNYVATDSPTETTVNPATSNTFLSEDTPSGESQANYRKTLEIQLPFTDTTTMAQRLQRTALLHSRQEVSLSVLCNIAFMQLQPFDWVYLTNSRLGYTNKTFEVLSTNLEVIESDDVPILATRLVLKEIDSSVYAFASSSYTNPIDEGSSVSTGSFSVTAPTGLSLSVDLQLDSATSKVNIDASWTNNPDDLIQGTEILYGTASDTYIGSILVGKGKTKAVIPNLLSNSTYYVVARHFSSNNVFSDNTAEQSVGTGLPAAPSAPTNLTATTGKALVIGLEWDAPSNSDLRAVKVYRHTSSFTPTDDTYLVSTITSEPSETQKITFGLEDGLTAGTTYHFAVRAINFSGTHSSFTSTTTGSFTLVDAGDIDLPEFSGYFHKEGTTTTALTASQFNTEYGRQPLVDDILIMVNTSASPKVSKAYKWSGSTFVEITNFTTGDLVVDGTLAGDKIIAQSISADRVDTDFISTLNLLTTSATVTNNITIGTGDNVFKAETGVGIHLGDAVFADAPFSVTEAGVLKAESGTIGGINLASNKLYVGTGTVNNSNTAFYVDDSGNFSLKDKVYWNGTSLSVDGNITATTLDVVEANIQNLTLTLGGGILQDGSGNNLTVTNVINPDFPVDGLLHYFPLNGFSDPNDTTPADVVDVVSNVTGVITGSNGSFSTDSPNGQSYVNGATTGITLLSDAQADTWQSTTGDYTVALWFKSTTESGGGSSRIIGRDASDFWSLALNQNETGNQAVVLFTDGESVSWDGASVNEWHHLALVVNGTTSAKLYVDGVLRATDTNIAYTTNSRPVVLGCNTESSIVNTNDVFIGKLSDVRFYTKAITDKQVQSLYMNPAGGLPAKIEGDLFVTNSITSDKLIVNDLSSLSANLGSITAGDIDIGSGAFSVTSAGVLDASGATISGSFSSGTGNSIFKADTNGIYLGNATFGSAPFRVSTGGALTATSGTIGGVTLATNKIHLGTGTFNNSNTAFYVDTAGQFSLKDKLSFNGADLIINGKINPPILSSSGQAGLYSLIPTSITGGSDDPQPVISADTDTDLGTVILATGDPYDSSLWTSGSPDTNATGLWLGGSGTIYMLGTGQSFRNSPISSGINSLGTNANGWKALFLHSHSSYSDTTNALYSIGGSLYFNGSQLGTGSGDITGVTITTSGGSLTGGASYSSGNATFTLDIGSTITGAKTFDNNVVIQGNLDVQGTTTTIDTTNLDVKDKNITLNYGTGDTSANANGAGITIQDAVNSTTDATLTWNTSNDSFNFSHPLNVTGNIGVTGTVDGRDIATDGTKLDGIESGATTDQTQSEINALGITATGLSGSPNITVGTISSGAITSTGTSTFDGITFANGGDRSLTGPLNEDLIINARPNDTSEGLHLQIGGTDKLFIKQDGIVRLVNTGLLIDSGGFSPSDVEGQHFKYYLVGQGTDLNFKKVADVTISTGLYKALALRVVLESEADNFGSSVGVDKSEFVCSFYRSAGSQDDSNTATISGQNPTNHNLRIVKTATGVYELQVKQTANYKDAILHIEILSTNGGSITITDGNVNGSTSGTITTPNSSETASTYSFNKVDTPFLNIQNNIKVNSTEILDSARNLTNIGTISSGAITASASSTIQGNLLLDSASAEINLKSGVGTESGAVNWTFNTTGTNYASIKLPYDTRATTGFHIDSGYPLTLDGTTRINFAISGTTRYQIEGTSLKAGGQTVLDSGTRNLTNIGTISSGVISSTANITSTATMNINASGTADTFLNIGTSTSSNHYAYIDLVGDSTYTDYGLRLIRNNSGANTSSALYHRGTGNLIIETDEVASIKLRTDSSDALTIDGTQNATFAGNITTSTGTITAHTITATNTLTLPTAIDLSTGNNRITFNGDTSTGLFFDEGEPEFVLKGSTATPTYVEGLGIRNGSTNTDIIDQSRNLTNIGTISSGQVNATTTADATPAIIATNTGGLSSTIARFVGDSDSLEIRNEATTGDYRISNTGQENGIVLYDGTAGVEVFYNGSAVQTWNSSGGTDLVSGDFKVGGTTVIQSATNSLVNIGVVTASDLISTDSHVQSGDGSGGVALTINDGYGNANVTWNHLSGVPEQNGNSARIEVNTDSTSNATMYFELKSGVTSGVAVQTTGIMSLIDAGLYMASGKTIAGDGGVTINANDVDFVVSDTTDSITNFIWRDFSSSKLYLGTDTAVVTLRSNLDALDKVISAGSLGELQIFNDGSNSVIRSSDNLLIQRDTSPRSAIKVTDSTGKVELYYAGSAVLETTSTGISVTDTINFTDPTAFIRNSEDASGQIIISVLNPSSVAKAVRWDAANNANGAWRPDVTAISDLGLTNRVWDDLYINQIKIGASNQTFVDISRNVTAASISATTGVFSSTVNIDGELRLDARADGGTGDNVLAFKDSSGNYSIRQNVNDGNGNYSISLGYSGDGVGEYAVTGDGVSKILFSGHGQDGGVSLNAAPTGTAGNNISFSIGLLVEGSDNTIRVGASANGTGLDSAEGTKVFDASGNAFATSYSVGSQTVINSSGQIIGDIITQNIDMSTGNNRITFDGNTSTGLFYDEGEPEFVLKGSTATPLYVEGLGIRSGTTNTDIIDASRNLSNIGTISSGAITSTGINNSSAELIDLDNSTYLILKDPQGSAGIYIGGTGDTNNYYDNNSHFFRSKTGGTLRTLINADGVDAKFGGFRINGTTVIDSSRNLTNITAETITGSLNEALNFSASTTNDARGISFNARTALTADSSDGWLRLNQNSEFSNGVYTPANFRSDGNVRGASYSVVGTVVIDNSRNLTNIGTGAFTGKVTISNANYNQHLEISRTGQGTFGLTPSANQLLIIGGGFSPASNNAHDLGRTDKYWQDLWLGTSLKMGGTTVIDSSRNLTNIGTATTSGKLNVGNAAINGRNMIEIQTSANTLDRGISFQNSGAAYSNSIFAEDVGGNDARLVFTGGNASSTITALTRDFMINNQSGGGGVSGDIHARGDVVAFSSTVSSDERLKYDIEYIKNPLEIIQSLKGRHFKWKKNQQQSSGVIAQEVEQSEMSFLVSDKVDIENPDETIKRVKYDGFIGVLIEAIKEQQQQIEELKSKLEDIV